MPVGVSAYIPLATVTLTGATTVVQFTSISQAYKDLVVVFRATSQTYDTAQLTFNNNYSGDYSWVYAMGDSGNATSAMGSGMNRFNIPYSYGLDSRPSICQLDIFDYSSTTKRKTCLFRAQGLSNRFVDMEALTWNNTSAITSMRFYVNTYAVGSTFTLYGIAG